MRRESLEPPTGTGTITTRPDLRPPFVLPTLWYLEPYSTVRCPLAIFQNETEATP